MTEAEDLVIMGCFDGEKGANPSPLEAFPTTTMPDDDDALEEVDGAIDGPEVEEWRSSSSERRRMVEGWSDNETRRRLISAERASRKRCVDGDAKTAMLGGIDRRCLDVDAAAAAAAAVEGETAAAAAPDVLRASTIAGE